MDIVIIITVIAAACGFVGLAWMAGFELGQASATDAARKTRPTVTELVGRLNKQKPRVTSKRRASK